MILKKRFYSVRSFPLSILFLLYKFFKDLLIQGYEMENVASNELSRPALKKKSSIVVGDWKRCQQFCPVNCLIVESDSYKLKKMSINLYECIGCGECIKVAPENAIENKSLSFFKGPFKKDFFSFDLIEERDSQ